MNPFLNSRRFVSTEDDFVSVVFAQEYAFVVSKIETGSAPDGLVPDFGRYFLYLDTFGNSDCLVVHLWRIFPFIDPTGAGGCSRSGRLDWLRWPACC